METLKLKKCGNIDSFEMSLSPLIVFQGPENEMKTFVAKLLVLFRNWEFQGKLLDYKTLLERFSIINLLSPQTKIEYESELRKIYFNGQYFEMESKISITNESIRLE